MLLREYLESQSRIIVQGKGLVETGSPSCAGYPRQRYSSNQDYGTSEQEGEVAEYNVLNASNVGEKIAWTFGFEKRSMAGMENVILPPMSQGKIAFFLVFLSYCSQHCPINT